MSWYERLVGLFGICFVLFMTFLIIMAFIKGPEKYRIRHQAIFDNGRGAALEGSPVEVCPYTADWAGGGENERKTWMNGYREGMREKNRKE